MSSASSPPPKSSAAPPEAGLTTAASPDQPEPGPEPPPEAEDAEDKEDLLPRGPQPSGERGAASLRSLRRERRAARRRQIAELFRRFIRAEATGGVVLLASTVLALALAHSPLAPQMAQVFRAHLGLVGAGQSFGLSVAEWINDGLMALFFLLVGMEIKRELIHGELDSPRKAALPVIAAGFGMLVPALIYLAVSAHGGPTIRRGWAIPTATDIAFTVGVMALLGRRVPMGLKVFVTALAIADDLGAVLVIALFYSAKLDLGLLALCAGLTVALILCNRLGVKRRRAYLILGGLLWAAMLHSGIHATIAGVILGLCTPQATAERLNRALQYPVALFVLPLFALCNAGITLPLDSASLQAALHEPVSRGVFFGLLVGKPLGIFFAAVLAVLLRVGQLPSQSTYRSLLGAAMLCGIGFTMSIFTGQLAFSDATLLGQAKLGILAGSLCSALAGSLLLRLTTARPD
jgi:NhaA family Na+:H+ antiporter